MARLNFEQKVVINGQEGSWSEKKAVEDWTWNRVKFWSFIFACLAAASGFLLLGYWLGGSGCYTCTQNKPATAVVATPSASSTQTSETTTITELDKTRWAILGMMAKQAAVAQASASATTTVVAPPPPKAEKRAPVTKQVEPPCQCPPEPAKAPTVDQNPPPPTPTLTSAERKRNEMWSALRR